MYLCLILVLALNAIIPQLIRWIIDSGINNKEMDVLTWSVLLLLGLTLFKGVFNFLMGIWSETASQNVAYDIRKELQIKFTQLSFAFHDKAETGELLSRAIQDVERLRFLTGRATLRIIDGIMVLVLTAVILISMNFRLALIVLLLMPFLVLQALNYGARYRPLSLQIQKQLARLTTVVEQNLRGSRIVKAYTQEQQEINRFEKENNEWLQLSTRAARMQAINTPLLFFIANLSTFATILYGGYQVITGTLSVGEVIAFITYISQMIDPIRRLGMIIPAVAIAGSAAERIFDIMDTIPEVKDDPNAIVLPRVSGEVIFEDIYFSYGNRMILSDINLEAKPGQVIALIGATGSGKTSLVNLVPRFYDPSSGTIKVDGIDIRTITLNSLRSQIGIVLQDSTLFAETIRNNILFGCEGASEIDVVNAAKAAQAHDFIVNLPQGYDTNIGERGATLSGGQKQRIAIARALLLDPRILILDDATSSVDTETENLIQLAMSKLIQNRTTFIIAHRLNTIINADSIFVLEKGQIVARGNHQDLIQTSTIYQDIYKTQFKSQETSL